MSDRVRTYRPGFFARFLPQGKWTVTLRPSLPAIVQISQNGANNLACLDIAAISVGKALLWHSVEVRTGNYVYSLPCLGEEAATQLAADLHSFINAFIDRLMTDQQALVRKCKSLIALKTVKHGMAVARDE